MLLETSVPTDPATSVSRSGDPIPCLSCAVVWFALVHLAPMALLLLAALLTFWAL
jgi:hypothetical protein